MEGGGIKVFYFTYCNNVASIELALLLGLGNLFILLTGSLGICPKVLPICQQCVEALAFQLYKVCRGVCVMRGREIDHSTYLLVVP